MEWISVEDRIPEINKNVLVCLSTGKMIYTDIMKRKIKKPNGDVILVPVWNVVEDDDIITHWMPMELPFYNNDKGN